MSEVKKAQKPSSPKKKDGDENTPAPVATVDARVAWFEERVLAALKVKGDKWRKYVSVPETT